MSTSAPKVRIVDALSGAKAPTEFFAALSEADSFCAEIDTLRELQTRVGELEAENADLADRLHSLNEAHQITLGLLATARNERDSMRWEVSR